MEKVEHAKESGHWYKKDGTPAYTYLNKKGEEKPTTLREAKKEGLVPGVTTIIKLMASQGLQNWFNDQIILACLTMPKIEGEAESDYIARIKKDAGEQAKKAREKGTEIHAVVQSGFEGKLSIANEYTEYYISARDTLVNALIHTIWKCETPFATERYGGKIDLLGGGYLLDIKTTSKDLENIKLWDDHYMQLAAYRLGVVKPCEDYIDTQCGILYINTETAESKLIMAEEKELERGWKMFNSLVDLYYAKSGL